MDRQVGVFFWVVSILLMRLISLVIGILIETVARLPGLI